MTGTTRTLRTGARVLVLGKWADGTWRVRGDDGREWEVTDEEMGEDMHRIAGMSINNGTAASLVVLARDGERWRKEEAETWALSALLVGPAPRHVGVPVILDAAEFHRYPNDPDANLSIALGSAGWDVRPPVWRDGRAANPSDDDLAAAWASIGAPGESGGPSASFASPALLLAAWGATTITTREPCPKCGGALRVPAEDRPGYSRPCDCRKPVREPVQFVDRGVLAWDTGFRVELPDGAKPITSTYSAAAPRPPGAPIAVPTPMRVGEAVSEAGRRGLGVVMVAVDDDPALRPEHCECRGNTAHDGKTGQHIGLGGCGRVRAGWKPAPSEAEHLLADIRRELPWLQEIRCKDEGEHGCGFRCGCGAKAHNAALRFIRRIVKGE